MKYQCPNCGQHITVNGLGRKPLNITVNNVCDALQGHSNVVATAKELGCSRAYIYKVLKENGLSLKDFSDPAGQRKSSTKHN